MVQTGEVLSHPAVCQLPIRIFAVEGEGTPNRKTAAVRAERAKCSSSEVWDGLLACNSAGPHAPTGLDAKLRPESPCDAVYAHVSRDPTEAWATHVVSADPRLPHDGLERALCGKFSEQLMELPNTAYDRVEASIDMDVSLQPR